MTKGGTARRARNLILGTSLAMAFWAIPAMAAAATLFLSPSSGVFGVGTTFPVVVRVSSAGQAVNAAEATLSFNPAVLRVQSISSAGSIFNLNVQEPEFSNSAGTVHFAGVILNPGFAGSAGNLVTVYFKAFAPGTSAVSFASAAVLANDGRGTNVLTGSSGGTYTVTETAATPVPTPGGGPVVTSPTHPDQNAWYNSNDPQFKWELSPDVDAVSYIINPKPLANPGNESDGLVSSAQYTDQPDGTSYFHIKFHRANGWGPVTHFQFNIDTEAPDPFQIVRIDHEDPTNPRPVLTFSTTDRPSGVVRYVIRIGDGEWTNTPAAPESSPFVMPTQPPGTRDVTVEAVDAAGNSTRSILSVTIEPITQPAIVQAPSSVPGGLGFDIACKADPNVTVRIDAFKQSGFFWKVFFSDVKTASVQTRTDGAGNCRAHFDPLPSGVYRLIAFATDERGAQSYGSEPVTVRVGYTFWFRLMEFLGGFLRDGNWLTILAWLTVVAALVIVLLGFARRRKVMAVPPLLVGATKSERDVNYKLGEIYVDITEEIALLDRLAAHRTLYPEERYLRSKLMQYRKMLGYLAADTHSRLAKKK